jgi:hypothetical protein
VRNSIDEFLAAEPVGVYEQNGGAGRAAIKISETRTLLAQLKEGVKKAKGDPVSEDELVP